MMNSPTSPTSSPGTPPALPAEASFASQASAAAGLTPPALASEQLAKPRKSKLLSWRSKRLWVLLIVAALFLGGLLWWALAQPDTRPLTAEQKQELDEKIALLQVVGEGQAAQEAGVLGTFEQAGERQDETQPYQAGAREIVFTEREINQLLREDLGLGDTVRVALRPNKIAVYADIPIEEDAALLGGKNIRLRSQITAMERDGQPFIALDDLTLWGISIPNDWLGGVKNQNWLATDTLDGELQPNALSKGIEKLQVRQGRVEIKLAQ